jgi:universal stress protein E
VQYKDNQAISLGGLFVAEQRVLVVVDPTASFHPAIERAAWLARSAPSILELFICDYSSQLADSRGDGIPAAAEARAALLARHKARLEQLAGPLAAQGLKVDIDSRWDYPLHDGIVRKAVDFGADFVVKDTHFHSVLKRSIFSNTDWSLIRNCPCPLLLVKPRPPGQRPCFVAAVDPLHERDKPADLDHKILRTAGSLAKALGGELHVFHAFDIAAALAVSTDSMTMPIALPVRELADAMRTEHTDAVDALCAAHAVPADHIHVHQGGTRELLMTLTEQLRADVVVMGAVSRSGLKGLFLGNTAEDVLDRLHCDLLIVKPDGFKAALPS